MNIKVYRLDFSMFQLTVSLNRFHLYYVPWFYQRCWTSCLGWCLHTDHAKFPTFPLLSFCCDELGLHHFEPFLQSSEFVVPLQSNERRLCQACRGFLFMVESSRTAVQVWSVLVLHCVYVSSRPCWPVICKANH